MAFAHRLIHGGSDFGLRLVEALGLQNHHVYRIVIDISADSMLDIYVEMHGDERLNLLNWEEVLKEDDEPEPDPPMNFWQNLPASPYVTARPKPVVEPEKPKKRWPWS